jgi:hypothetical protein
MPDLPSGFGRQPTEKIPNFSGLQAEVAPSRPVKLLAFERHISGMLAKRASAVEHIRQHR